MLNLGDIKMPSRVNVKQIAQLKELSATLLQHLKDTSFARSPFEVVQAYQSRMTTAAFRLVAREALLGVVTETTHEDCAKALLLAGQLHTQSLTLSPEQQDDLGACISLCASKNWTDVFNLCVRLLFNCRFGRMRYGLDVSDAVDIFDDLAAKEFTGCSKLFLQHAAMHNFAPFHLLSRSSLEHSAKSLVDARALCGGMPIRGSPPTEFHGKWRDSIESVNRAFWRQVLLKATTLHADVINLLCEYVCLTPPDFKTDYDIFRWEYRESTMTKTEAIWAKEPLFTHPEDLSAKMCKAVHKAVIPPRIPRVFDLTLDIKTNCYGCGSCDKCISYTWAMSPTSPSYSPTSPIYSPEGEQHSLKRKRSE
jgi:hypothetical protein